MAIGQAENASVTSPDRHPGSWASNELSQEATWDMCCHSLLLGELHVSCVSPLGEALHLDSSGCRHESVPMADLALCPFPVVRCRCKTQADAELWVPLENYETWTWPWGP